MAIDITQLPENLQTAAAPLNTPLPSSPAPDLTTLAPAPNNQTTGGQAAFNPAPDSFGAKLAKALDSNPIPLKPNGEPVPGAWAKSILASAQNVLGGVGAVGKVPEGAGGLYGAGKAMQYRAEATARIQRDQALTAHENAQALHESKVWSQLDQESKEKLIAKNKLELATEQASPLPPPILAEDIDSDEIGRQIKAGTLDPTKTHRAITGQKEDGTDKDGNPIMRDLYTITGQGSGTQTITPDMAKRYNAAFPNKTPWTSGPSSMSWQELKYQEQLVSNVETAKAIQEDNERKLGIEKEKSEVTKEVTALQQDPKFLKFMGQANLNGPAAYQLALADPNMVKNYPRLLKDFSEAVGPQVWDEQLKKAIDSHNEAAKTLEKLENDPSEISGEKAPAAIAIANERLNNPLTPAEERPRWQRVLNQATQAQKLTEQSKNRGEEFKHNLNAGASPITDKNKNLRGEEFVKTIPANMQDTVRAMGNYQLDSKDLPRGKERQPYLDATLHAYPGWDERLYQERHDYLKDYGSSTRGEGASRDRLNNAIGHLDFLGEASKAVAQNNIQILNQIANAYGVQTGKDPVVVYNGIAGKAAGELAGSIKGGSGSATDQEIANALRSFDPKLSPSQQAANVRTQLTLLKTVEDTIAGHFHNTMGKSPEDFGQPVLFGKNQQIVDKWTAPTNQPNSSPTPLTHKVGDIVRQGGHEFTVTSVDANGNITGTN